MNDVISFILIVYSIMQATLIYSFEPVYMTKSASENALQEIDLTEL